jgi:alpha-beta hydrolase superfamily lysophospholipase
MEIEEHKIFTNDGLKLHSIHIPVKKPIAVLSMIHGYAEHTGLYTDFYKALVEAGFAIFAVDLRGHGKSEGLRGHSPGLDYFLNDI